MTYTGNDLAAQARSYSSTASAATRRADREAGRAADFYRTAATVRGQARWLAGRPELWARNYTPAELDAQARQWTRLGDSFLRASFGATASAEFYRDLAASYRQMQASREACIAQLDARLAEQGTERRARLEDIRDSLRAEEISYGELAELQSLASHIDPGDTELLEAAGVPEYLADEAGPQAAEDWPEDQIDAMMPEEDQERFAALCDAADEADARVYPISCPRPTDHKLHTVNLYERCPHCGGSEPEPITPGAWDEPQAEADVVAAYAACWQAQAEDDAQLAAWETDGGACLAR